MVTRCILAALILTCLSSVTIAERILVVAQAGELAIFSLSAEKTIRETVVQPPFYARLLHVYYEHFERILIVATDNGQLYSVGLKEPSLEYRRLDTAGVPTFFVLYDFANGQPVWLDRAGEQAGGRLVGRVRNQGYLGTIESVNQLLFDQLKVSPAYIPGASLTAAALTDSHKPLKALLMDSQDSHWVILGRSRTVEGYGRVMLGLIRVGDYFRSELLFHDLSPDRWQHFNIPEANTTFVFEELALVRGTTRLNDGSGLHENRPSGNWYFYFPGADHLVQCSLDKQMEILYATANTAYIAKGSEVYMMDISPQGCGEPRHVLTLPKGVIPFRIYPLPSNSSTPEQ